MEDIPQEIMDKIEEKVNEMSLFVPLENEKIELAIFCYHLRDEEVDELKAAALGKAAKWYADLLNQKDQRIKELEDGLIQIKQLLNEQQKAQVSDTFEN